jgi:hypothetical protein
MSRWSRLAGAGLALACFAPATGSAQGYRIRLDTRFQTVAFRGVTPDSIAAGSVVSSSGALETPDGFAVTCAPAAASARSSGPDPS